MRLETEALCWRIAARRIVDEVSLHVVPGEFVGLIGPNGSGKSSLLRMIYRVLRPSAGWVALDGQSVWRLSARENARRMAVLAQENGGEFDFCVREMVSMGRTPHKAFFAQEHAEDRKAVDAALQRVGAAHLAERSFLTLSGGEKQRVLIARALAQEARILVLDEPTNHLDVYHQFEIMALIRGLKVSVIAALHELNLAAHYCDRLYLIDAGRLIAQGSPAEVLTPEIIRAVYRVRAEVALHPVTRKPSIHFLPDEAAGPSPVEAFPSALSSADVTAIREWLPTRTIEGRLGNMRRSAKRDFAESLEENRLPTSSPATSDTAARGTANTAEASRCRRAGKRGGGP